ncbi:ATP-binding protein [Propionivibrio limicola]|uniref:ATP-binding protein n=1 Tax=Propionivibrio limicola TaxID=167645 RepID=UPI0012913F44|nr:ATP-binding protein [Propionivibrio limicola]
MRLKYLCSAFGRRVSRLFPASLFARTALILLAGLVAAQAISFWLHWGERAVVVSQARGLHLADRMADAVRLLEADKSQRRVIATARLRADGIQVAPVDSDEVFNFVPRGQIQAMLAMRLGSTRDIRSPDMMGGGGNWRNGMGRMQREAALPGAPRTFDIRLDDGQWVRFTASHEAPAPALPHDFLTHLLVSLIAVTAVAMLAVRQVIRPLQQLAGAADALGHDLGAPPLPEEGSSEMRRAAQAFNRMRERIKRLVDERSRALAAVSHDLRTPLTRLRLRAELIDNEALRDQMAADLETMSAMLEATLDYLRGLQENETQRPIDINALLNSLVEDAAVLGKNVSTEGAAMQPYRGRLTALRRALQNLIDNAIKYGRSAHVRIEDGPQMLRLVVEDDGPGIPPEDLARVTEPYYRPDASRRAETGGVGLGLSIVKDIALMHGGELLLANRPLGGLAATLVLPRETGNVASAC